MADEIAAVKRERKRTFDRQKQERWLKENGYTSHLNASGQITWDYDKAPDPSDLPGRYYETVDFVGVQWGSGFAVITAEAFAKLPASKLKLLQPRRPQNE